MGRGDRRHSDRVAVEAMRDALAEMPINGRIVIGEGERDKAPMLWVGEEVGGLAGSDDGPAIDIAVDPLEGTNLCATGDSGAIAVMAVSERGGLLYAPDVYMEKLVVGPTARGRVDLDAPVAENLAAIAAAYDREIHDLVVVVLDRERHAELIADIREAGARIRLIGDGDLSAGISAAVRGTGIHAVFGIGGAPEGVITAAAMRCLGGEIQARLRPLNDEQKARVAELGIDDIDRIYSTEELASGEDLVFVSCGVTDGQLLRGVRFFGGGCRTSTLFMSMSDRVIRFVDTIRRDQLDRKVYFH
jgi:fructose-1,6-bisphosphatase class II